MSSEKDTWWPEREISGEVLDRVEAAYDDALSDPVETIVAMMGQRELLRREIETAWRKALDRFDLALRAARKLCKALIEHRYARAEHERDYLAKVQILLFVRACVITGEVRALLGAGYASGALARWRSLHECAIVALLLARHGDELAERFWDHGAIEARSFQREYHIEANLPDSKAEAWGEEAISELNADVAALRERWGKAFLEPHGWASEVVGNARPSYLNMEKSLNLRDHLAQRYRWRYRLASWSVHPTVWSFLADPGDPRNAGFRLGLGDQRILGPIDYGLAEPADQSLASLDYVIQAALSIERGDDWTVRLVTVHLLIEDARQAFTAVSTELDALLSEYDGRATIEDSASHLDSME